ncbi:amidase family protein [Paenisporosarcina indica]|uniref:amidase family protein n=1 Tax=Paenisporosarcina indica TaxID=650093 RepID=UPI00094F7FA9|nr:amidase family protein [Paenisporosarcina indica]
MNQAKRKKLMEEWLDEATIAQMQEKMATNEMTSEDLVFMYLEIIAERNPNINAVLEVNSKVIQIAQALDDERLEKGPRSMLHGIPILIKDNIDTADDLHTSAGSLSLANHYALKDATLVKKLRDSGAIILGKTNMTEWANFMSDRMTNGYSSRGGQVKNPYGPFDVGGSSSGSAAAIAANLAAAAIGTETSGSILNPAAQNGLVGLKPTVGAISRTGIIPLAHTQDTAGPMTRTVEDAVHVFSSIIGKDEFDSITRKSRHLDKVDWINCLDLNALRGKRIGIARSIFDREVTTERAELFDKQVTVLRELGADIVDNVDLACLEDDLGYAVLTHEFKADLNSYLGKTRPSNPIRSLADVINFNKQHSKETLPYGQVLLEKSERTTGTLIEKEYIEALERNRYLAGEIGLSKSLDDLELDALVFPQDHGCSIGAAAGCPSITVPAGFSQAGEPFGLTFSGRAWSEPLLISIAYAFEQRVQARRKP